MPKNKLRRFAELKTFDHVIQPAFSEVFQKDHLLKGRWNKDFFRNDHPLVLELGCGKGEYTVTLAREFPFRNYIGMDIKGSRIWKGARTVLHERINNAAFIRSHIELICSFFGRDEAEEIWLTFPDPQPKKAHKRLSSSRFLGLYQKLLRNNGNVHLKTDSALLFGYTLRLIRHNNLKVTECYDDLYKAPLTNPILAIRTYYEQQFIEKGMKIHYICFELPNEKTITEPPEG